MNKKEIEKQCGYQLPSNVGFTLENNQLEVVISNKSLDKNMQNDPSAFEGWIICLMAIFKNDAANCIKSVNILFDETPTFDNCSSKDRQFYYRLYKAHKNYGWTIEACNKIEEITSWKNKNIVLTTPSDEAQKEAANIEAKLERIFIENHANGKRKIYQQLPLGLFNDNVAEKNRLLPTSYLDMWEIDNNTLKLYELKAKGNTKVGILSELIYYTNIIEDFIYGNYEFAKCKRDYRGIDKLKECQEEKCIKRIQGIFLTDGLHPMIANNKEVILEILNKRKNTTTLDIIFSFEENKDYLSVYSDFKEKEREHHEALLCSDNNVFPAEVRGGGWYKDKKRSFCLQKGQEYFNLYEEIRDDVKHYFETEHIAFWGNEREVPNHTLSSQVACLNHLFAIRNDPETVIGIAKAITGRDDIIGMKKVDCDQEPQYIAFEVVSKDDHLNENTTPNRGAFCTSIDAVMLADLKGGGTLLIMIEWKYTESYSSNDKSKESDPDRPMQPEAKGIERLKRYCQLITNSEDLESISIDDTTCENELELNEDILPYRGSIYFQEPYYQLMRQTLWAEQMIKYQSSEKIKATEFMHIHVIPAGNKELLNTGFDGEQSENAMCESWKKQLKKDIYKWVDPQKIRNVLKEKDEKLYDYLCKRYGNQ